MTRQADRDGCVADDFYSTTNHKTQVRIDGVWVEVAKQRMDAVVVIEGATATCRKLRDVRKGDAVVCGVNGIRVMPEFRERDRHGFAFMTNDISSERRVETAVTRVATWGIGATLGYAVGGVIAEATNRPVALIVAAVLQTAVPIAIFGAKRFRTLRSIEQAVALDARRA